MMDDKVIVEAYFDYEEYFIKHGFRSIKEKIVCLCPWGESIFLSTVYGVKDNKIYKAKREQYNSSTECNIIYLHDWNPVLMMSELINIENKVYPIIHSNDIDILIGDYVEINLA